MDPLSRLLVEPARSLLRAAQKGAAPRPGARRAGLAATGSALGVPPAARVGRPALALRVAPLPMALRADPLPAAWRVAPLPTALQVTPFPTASRATPFPMALQVTPLPTMSSAAAPTSSAPPVWETLPAWAKMAARPRLSWSCPLPGCRSTSPSQGRYASPADAAFHSGDRASQRASRRGSAGGVPLYPWPK